MEKKIIVTTVLMALLVSSGYCQPKIVIMDTNVVDLGKVYNAGDHILKTFEIKNAGDQPLRITGIRTSCGCTAAVPSDSTIAPGERSKIKVDFNPAGYSGNIIKFVYIISNDPKNQMATLELMMDIAYAIQSNPNFILFPSPRIGKPDTSAVTVTNSSNDPMKITGIETNAEEISYHVENSTLNPGQSTRLQFYLVGKKPGPIYGEVIVHTSSKLQPKLTIRYYAGVN